MNQINAHENKRRKDAADDDDDDDDDDDESQMTFIYSFIDSFSFSTIYFMVVVLLLCNTKL